jgi:hypothetical protein
MAEANFARSHCDPTRSLFFGGGRLEHRVKVT